MKKIEYRHHPHFGAEVRVVRTLRHFRDELDTVEFTDGRRLGVPQWMLDPEACRRLSQTSKPRIAIIALLRLIKIYEAHHLIVQCDGSDSSVSSPSAEGDYAQSKQRSIPSNPVGFSRENAMGQIPHGPENSLPRALATDPAEPSAQPTDRKETR